MKRERSIGVIFFGIGIIIIGVIGLNIFVPDIFSKPDYRGYKALIEFKRSAFVAICYSSVMIFAGIGILLLKKWARILVIVLSLIVILAAIYEFFTEIPQYYPISNAKRQFEVSLYIFWLSAQIIISLFTLFFFSRSKVKQQFMG